MATSENAPRRWRARCSRWPVDLDHCERSLYVARPGRGAASDRSPASSSATILPRVPSRALRSCSDPPRFRGRFNSSPMRPAVLHSRIAGGQLHDRGRKGTYLALSYGQTTAGRGSGLPIALEAGQQLRDLRLVLPRGSPISGRVVDDRSRPVANAPIQVMQYRTVNGERTLTTVGGSWPQTDAHGEYRAYGLPPGDYIVCPIHPATSRRFRRTAGPAEAARAHVKSPRPRCSGLASRFRPADARWRLHRRAADARARTGPIGRRRSRVLSGGDECVQRHAHHARPRRRTHGHRPHDDALGDGPSLGDHSWIGRAAGGRRRRALLGWLRDNRNHQPGWTVRRQLAAARACTP